MQATASPLASAVLLLAGLLAAAGWPILLFMDGTGGTAESEFISELGFAPLPYIVASIAPLYSGDRMFGTSKGIGGTQDGCSPLEVVEHLATALGVQIANPLFDPLFGTAALEPTTTTLPVSGNLAGGRTGVIIQLDTGHFGASTNPQIGRTFVESMATGARRPTVNPGALSSDMTPGCSGRFDPL